MQSWQGGHERKLKLPINRAKMKTHRYNCPHSLSKTKPTLQEAKSCIQKKSWVISLCDSALGSYQCKWQQKTGPECWMWESNLSQLMERGLFVATFGWLSVIVPKGREGWLGCHQTVRGPGWPFILPQTKGGHTDPVCLTQGKYALAQCLFLCAWLRLEWLFTSRWEKWRGSLQCMKRGKGHLKITWKPLSLSGYNSRRREDKQMTGSRGIFRTVILHGK